MCWNKEISLNTFIFSSFVLGLIIYNNAYTQYKIVDINNIWVYLFFISFILMQLIEFFIWRNVNNPIYNKLFTIMATLLLLVQPIATNMLITNKSLQRSMLFLYLICMIPFAIYRFMTKNINSTVSKMGHLQWNNVLNNNKWDRVILIIWLLFFLFPLFYERQIFGFLFGLLTLLVIIYNYYKDDTIGSMWCWVVNSLMLYYAGYLLFYLPFFK